MFAPWTARAPPSFNYLFNLMLPHMSSPKTRIICLSRLICYRPFYSIHFRSSPSSHYEITKSFQSAYGPIFWTTKRLPDEDRPAAVPSWQSMWAACMLPDSTLVTKKRLSLKLWRRRNNQRSGSLSRWQQSLHPIVPGTGSALAATFEKGIQPMEWGVRLHRATSGQITAPKTFPNVTVGVRPSKRRRWRC